MWSPLKPLPPWSQKRLPAWKSPAPVTRQAEPKSSLRRRLLRLRGAICSPLPLPPAVVWEADTPWKLATRCTGPRLNTPLLRRSDVDADDDDEDDDDGKVNNDDEAADGSGDCSMTGERSAGSFLGVSGERSAGSFLGMTGERRAGSFLGVTGERRAGSFLGMTGERRAGSFLGMSGEPRSAGSFLGMMPAPRRSRLCGRLMAPPEASGRASPEPRRRGEGPPPAGDRRPRCVTSGDAPEKEAG